MILIYIFLIGMGIGLLKIIIQGLHDGFTGNIKVKETNELSADDKRTIIELTAQGKGVEAVSLVRQKTGIKLSEAMRVVESVKKEGYKYSYNAGELKDEISDISFVDGMDGHEFEHYCANLLRKIDYTDVKVTPGSGDQGVDIIAIKDGVKYAFQCKNYSSSLGNTPVQEVAAGKVFYGCHVGVVITNSTFTPGAVQLANATNVLLWDRTKLAELISMAKAK